MGLRGRTKLLDQQCFFVTSTCHNFLPLIEEEICKQILYDSLAFVNKKFSCEIIAYVWMPNHIHFICYFREKNFLMEYMRDFKKYTSHKIREHFVAKNELEIIIAIRYEYRKQHFKIWM